MKIGNCRKIVPEKIEFEYYIFNVFLIAAKCILLNFVKTTKIFLGKINAQRCCVTLRRFPAVACGMFAGPIRGLSYATARSKQNKN